MYKNGNDVHYQNDIQHVHARIPNIYATQNK